MKRAIYFLFGKPYTNSRFYNFFYWFAIISFFLAIIVSGIEAFILLDLHLFISLIISVIIFPIIFRLIYKLNTSIHHSIFFKFKKRTIFILIGIIGLIFTVITLPSFFSEEWENIVVNQNKVVTNGEVEWSAQSLKGDYNIESFDIVNESQATIKIPFKANAKEGELILSVEQDGEMVWEDEINGVNDGIIEFKGEIGTYDIMVYTTEAKKIMITLSIY